MMRRWIAGMVVGAAVAVTACGNSPVLPRDELVVGSWLWVESTGGIAGTTRSPQSEGQSMSIRFGADGTVELTIVPDEGEPQTRSTTYELVDVGEDEATARIEYTEPTPFGFPGQDVEFDGPDTLILTDDCCDGFVSRWTRLVEA